MENFFLVLQVMRKSERVFGTRILDVSLAKKKVDFITKKERERMPFGKIGKTWC